MSHVKEKTLVLILLTLIGLFMICVAVTVSVRDTDSISRTEVEQPDFDEYEFINPDGSKFKPCNAERQSFVGDIKDYA